MSLSSAARPTSTDDIARAVLYGNLVPQPHLPRAKTLHRSAVGGIFPDGFVAVNASTAAPRDPSTMQVQCILIPTPAATITITLRFLHLVECSVEEGPAFHAVPQVRVADQDYCPCQETVEREVTLAPLLLATLLHHPLALQFSFDGGTSVEAIRDADPPARLVRTQQSVTGQLQLSAESLAKPLVRITFRVLNRTPIAPHAPRDAAVLASFAAAHFLLRADHGDFLSLTDPPSYPPTVAAAAAACENIGCWPVLLGERGRTDTLLASAILLPDYPQVSAEDPGEFLESRDTDGDSSSYMSKLPGRSDVADHRERKPAANPRDLALLQRAESGAPEEPLTAPTGLDASERDPAPRPDRSERRHP